MSAVEALLWALAAFCASMAVAIVCLIIEGVHKFLCSESLTYQKFCGYRK